ncbi:hypothetical protein [Bacillus sp. CECT 9360]|uniref:hypothetical protein n=1 Tax=Bacillus sp. CECT 9360 TaxID=2845821 RepID=UPI001E49000D|nr:hypothetical protein [Bacillus sp. CECT 9360]CAH0345179.1 hypothetical protein BCI9360_01458 [Bacillus sp. CECT 9360]
MEGKFNSLFFLAILAGFALLVLLKDFLTPAVAGFALFAPLKPLLFFIAVLVIIVFSLFIIWKALRALFQK